jgi:hypothetical protein
VRVVLDEPAEIDIEILDVAGELVARHVIQGVPSVNEIVWETSGVASGVYVVRVQASVPLEAWPDPTGASGRSETKIMKVAILR